MRKKMNKETFANYCGYKKLITLPAGIIQLEMTKLTSQGVIYGWDIAPQDLVGIEIEIEHAPAWVPGSCPIWSAAPDNSLRNGYELKTIPIHAPIVPYAVHKLNTIIHAIKKMFSERTSVHVHVDFRNQTAEDLIKFLLIHLAFEKYLFEYAGPSRYQNTFCTPSAELSWRNVVRAGCKDMRSLHESIDNQDKYAAFNLKNLFQPVADDLHYAQGTVEFRHMAGNMDVELITTWAKIILLMKAYAISTPLVDLRREICDLNTNSYYMQFAEKVFGNYSRIVVPEPKWESLIEAVRFIKECFSYDMKVTTKSFLRSPLALRIQESYEDAAPKNNPEPKIANFGLRPMRVNWGQER